MPSTVQLQTPVLFLIFNRPKVTEQVFESIRQARPLRLFVAGDGPRLNRSEDVTLCEQTRRIATNIDWPCELKVLFRSENLGCKKAVSGAITWFFDNVEEGIILEDDCLPDASFYSFCSEMLNRFRDDKRIMVISGNHFGGDRTFGNASYYFTRIPHIWGWATWKRTWKLYDVEMRLLNEFTERNIIRSVFVKKIAWNGFVEKLRRTQQGDINTWDYQLCFCVWTNNGLCINPQRNLVSNIGHTVDATHTNSSSQWAGLPRQTLDRLVHPEMIVADITADEIIIEDMFRLKPFVNRLVSKIKKIKS